MPKQNKTMQGTCASCGENAILYPLPLPGSDRQMPLCRKCLEAMQSACAAGLLAISKEEGLQDRKKNACDPEYARIVRKFSKIYGYLCQYWDEDAVIQAHARHASIENLTEKMTVPDDRDTSYYDSHPEYFEFLEKRTGYFHVIWRGKELAERERKNCYVYLTANKYQGLIHGKVILDLLYGTWPQLEQFAFKAYGLSGKWEDYEIYPKDMDIYVPIQAIFTHDPEKVRRRCMDYAKSYHHGAWTPNETEKRLQGQPAIHLLDTIASLSPLPTLPKKEAQP